MKKIKPLDYKYLRLQLDPKQLQFETTTELAPDIEFVGQERAVEAIQFGIGIKSHGYNLFVMGPSDIDKRAIVRSLLKVYAKMQKTPPDWCYIHNFANPEKPIAIKLPAGLGFALQQDMKAFINELPISILSIFESDEYQLGIKKITDSFNRKRAQIQKKVSKKLKKRRIIPHLYRERHEEENELEIRMAKTVLHPFIEAIKTKFLAFPKVLRFLDAVEKDILEHVRDFILTDEISGLITFETENPLLDNYQINLLVNNRLRTGVPVIFEENPTYSNLICRVEYKPQLGTLITDFTLIRPGALHRANQGFLIMDARKLRKDKNAWEALKSALFSGKIKIEPIEHIIETARPISLKPKSIPLQIKIILLGERHFYYRLCRKDTDFSELFKVLVDFDDVNNRNIDTIIQYARLIATFIKRKGLRPFHSTAVAAIIDHSTRLAEDTEKLTTYFRRIEDLIIETDYWASIQEKQFADADDVKSAIQAQIHRMDRSRELYYEDITRNFIMIKTKDKVVGQVNCLSVVAVGKFSYGHPTRVTAKVHVGKGKFIDIQREIRLTGPIHSKAGLIIANFLADHYIQTHPFSLAASIAFEQIYGMVDGDSASVAELVALLSALSLVPINQALSVTGSVNQYGEVQAVGGINEKIEGYFDICQAKGLTGKQGVIMPRVNAKNLMLREDVVEACRNKKFFIYPIETVDEAILLLTGMPPGERDEKGNFPKLSFNGKVQAKLIQFSESRFKRK